MTIRLNGWQRLWIVVSLLYLVPIVALNLLTWPIAASTLHRDEFITRMPTDLRAHVDAAYGSEYERNQHNYLGAREVKAKTTAPTRTNIPPPPDFVLVSAPVSFPNGAVLDVHVAKEGDTMAGGCRLAGTLPSALCTWLVSSVGSPRLSCSEVTDADARLWHPWLRINRVLRAMLHERWSAEAWPQIKVEFKKALALKSQIRRAGWFN